MRWCCNNSYLTYLIDASLASTSPVCLAVSHPAKLVGPLNPILGVASSPTSATGKHFSCEILLCVRRSPSDAVFLPVWRHPVIFF